MRRLLDAVLGMALVATATQAAPRPALHNYLTVYHHSALAHGKPVKAVYAHTGVLMRNPDGLGGETFWVQVQHLPMRLQGDHYFAKARFQEWAQPGGPEPVGVMVQYWVYFEDGTERKTRDIPVHLDRHVYGTWGPAYVGALGASDHEHNRREDAARTGGWEVTVRPRS